MKSLIVGDVHFSQYSSIVRRRGEFYSKRLENCIRSLCWAENLATQQHCDNIIYLGDFFDTPQLNAEELCALREIQWANIPHFFLVGNHELLQEEYNSAEILSLIPQVAIAREPIIYNISNNTTALFLPYIINDPERTIAKEMLTQLKAQSEEQNHKSVVFSHNDLKGIWMGSFLSQEGIDLDCINQNCDLFINGHIHNGAQISAKVINVGNLTGQNFSEDATKYMHRVMLLDLDTLEYDFVENPHAFNFYKDEVDSDSVIANRYKAHAVISARCALKDADSVRKKFQETPEIEEFRLVTFSDASPQKLQEEVNLISSDPISQFIQYVQEHVEYSDYLIKELQEI